MKVFLIRAVALASSVSLITMLLLFQTGKWNPFKSEKAPLLAQNIADTTPKGNKTRFSSSKVAIINDQSNTADSASADSLPKARLFSSKSAPMPIDKLGMEETEPKGKLIWLRPGISIPIIGDSILKKFRQPKDSSQNQKSQQ